MKIWLFTASLFVSFFASQAYSVPFEGHQIAISGASHHAVEAGKKTAQAGGNITDVMVSVGLTMAVTTPYFASLGGGGFALLKIKDKVEVLDFREVAPRKTDKNYYVKKPALASTQGGTAVGVPGYLHGLWSLHKKYGKLKWSQLLETPIELAENGFQLSGEWVERTERSRKKFTPKARRFFFKEDGRSYKPGEIFKQKKLAKALKKISGTGIISFYQGEIAEDIVTSVNYNGGSFQREDLKAYKPKWREPIETKYAGHKIYLMPPPSSGGVMIRMALSLFEKLNIKKYAALSVDELHLMAETMSRSFRHRSLLGDPDFHKNPLKELFSQEKTNELAQSINIKKTKMLTPINEKNFNESSETTHFSVMNSKGQAISLTVTLNGNYGSGVVTEQYGIALNNEMDDFTTKPGEPNMFGLVQGSGNYVEAGKRPLSSMSPTLVEKNGEIVMSIGAPGGPRIINAVLQVLHRVLAQGMNLDRAIQTPRVHHQFLPNKLFVDGQSVPYFAPETKKGLADRGHDVQENWIARVYAVRKNEKGFLEAAHDSRGEGFSGGY